MIHKHFTNIAHHAKSFVMGAYHHGKKFLNNVDVYAGMFKRVLGAAQPALEDLGIREQVMGPALRGLGKFEQLRAGAIDVHEKAQEHYSKIAAAVQ